MIRCSSEALLDLAGHVIYLRHEAGDDIAVRFVDNVERGLLRVEMYPHLGRRRRFRQSEIRSWSVPGFKNWLSFPARFREALNGFACFTAPWTWKPNSARHPQVNASEVFVWALTSSSISTP